MRDASMELCESLRHYLQTSRCMSHDRLPCWLNKKSLHFFFFWFPTNVNSPVQDDIPREVKFVNVLYYRKCCTDIPSHFLLCWLICNKIDDKIEVSWGGHISNIKLREKMEAKMLCSSGEEQKNMSLLVHYQIRLKIT